MQQRVALYKKHKQNCQHSFRLTYMVYRCVI